MRIGGGVAVAGLGEAGLTEASPHTVARRKSCSTIHGFTLESHLIHDTCVMR